MVGSCYMTSTLGTLYSKGHIIIINFVNFYQQFIQSFSRIETPFTSILKTTKVSNLAPRDLKVNGNEVIRAGDKANDKNLFKKLKNRNSEIQIYIEVMGEPIFLIHGIKETFNQLK